ncbi:MAG: MucR family transcriptional regulator [Alphaproteobacteria bacterium]|nr:MucR family transcriptional regulator [Alphaproteobacteria bacterium]
MAEAERNEADRVEITVLTAEIVSAYVGHHTVATTDLPALISTVGREIAGLGQAPTELEEEEKPVPAVPIRRSVTPDHIICLEDGKKLKMLKRHLKTRYDMTPEDYRRRWGLKDDYPMVAPSYAQQRSDLAKKIDLGRKPEPTKPAKAPRKRATKKPAAKKGRSSAR